MILMIPMQIIQGKKQFINYSKSRLKTPNNVAIVFEDNRLTYKELNQKQIL